MAAYKDIVGQKITVVTSNPPNPKTGQMWYNSTDGKLRGIALLASTTSQTSMSRSGNRNQFGTASGGSADANWAGSGSPGTSNITEEFNGFGFPVATSQNAHALVHISPIIKKVACLLLQHSVILGQFASWQTVFNLC